MSFFDINKEKQKLAKVINLPPIERIQSVQKSLNQTHGGILDSTGKLPAYDSLPNGDLGDLTKRRLQKTERN